MQHCNMFQTHIFKEIFNKILLMQCSHSRHANIIQVQSYNCNKTRLVYIDANITSIKTFQKCPKNGKHELHAIVYAKKTQDIHATL